MAIQSHRIEPSVEASLRSVLDEASGEVLAVNFDERTTSGLVEVLSDLETLPSVRLLTTEDVLKWLRDDFVLASTAAELIEAETLAVRAATESLENTLVVTEETVISLLTPDDDYSAALVTDDEEFVEAVRERWSSVWEESETFDLRTPAYSPMLESFDEEFGSAVASDFDTVLDALGSTRDETVLDEVGVSLLVAARHEKMLYEFPIRVYKTPLSSAC
jgi:hypothetical protein